MWHCKQCFLCFLNSTAKRFQQYKNQKFVENVMGNAQSWFPKREIMYRSNSYHQNYHRTNNRNEHRECDRLLFFRSSQRRSSCGTQTTKKSGKTTNRMLDAFLLHCVPNEKSACVFLTEAEERV